MGTIFVSSMPGAVCGGLLSDAWRGAACNKAAIVRARNKILRMLCLHAQIRGLYRTTFLLPAFIRHGPANIALGLRLFLILALVVLLFAAGDANFDLGPAIFEI